MNFANDAELRNLFKFLSDKSLVSGDKALKESLVYGLENYALELPPTLVKDLKDAIAKNKSEFISFEEFKRFWVSNVNTIPDTQKFAQQTLHMIQEKIANQYIDEAQISLDGIDLLLQKFGEERIIPDLADKTKEERRKLAKKMIQAIDLEGSNTVGSIDLEFLIENYFNSIKKSN